MRVGEERFYRRVPLLAFGLYNKLITENTIQLKSPPFEPTGFDLRVDNYLAHFLVS